MTGRQSESSNKIISRWITLGNDDAPFGRPNRSNDTGESRHSWRALAGAQSEESHEVDPTWTRAACPAADALATSGAMAEGINTETTTVSGLDEVENATPVTVAFDARTPPSSS
jgi:hypothetical protein